jgi:hypothetical protein
MTRTTAFTIILGVFGFPALAADLEGNYVPLSLKDKPEMRTIHRNEPSTARTQYICYGDGIYPRGCDVAANKPRAPEKPKRASGAR